MKKKNVAARLLALFLFAMVMAGGIEAVSPVVEVSAATKIKLNKTKKTLNVGETFTLKLSGTSKTVTWKSSKKSVATVSSKGKVTAKKAGTATITATCSGKTYKCKITVKDKELDSKEIYAKCCDSVVEVNAGIALGSGFYISKYEIVTNYHVIDGATELSIITMDGEEYEVQEVEGFDQELDLAVLKVGHKGTPMTKNTHGITMGETTYTIGSSLGFTNTFSNGMVSNTERIMDGVNYIQTNTAISQGNSGGPLINAYGEVMGVTTASFTEGQNLNVAINISELDKLDLSDPITADDYIAGYNRKSGSAGGKTDNVERPSFAACVSFGGNGYHTYCYLEIENHGSKTLTLGGYSRVVLVYPSGSENYVGGYWYDDDSNNYLDSVICKSGQYGYATIRLDNSTYMSSGTMIAFYFVYDDVTYMCVVDDKGEGEWKEYIL